MEGGGKVRASLSVRYDDAAKIMVGDYLVTIEADSPLTWTDQAEMQIKTLEEFTGAP